jgi:hypothetical protein
MASRRTCGHTTCAVVGLDNPTAVKAAAVHGILDDFVRGFGFTGLGEAWIEVTREDAIAVVQQVLLKDLAYGVAMMPEAEACALAESFFSLFGSEGRCFTNGNLVLPNADPSEVRRSWNPITSATLDTGILCLDTNRIGIFWVEDED